MPPSSPAQQTLTHRPPPDRRQTQALFTGASRSYERMAQALSFGQYLRWRDRLVEAVLQDAPSEPRVLDVAVGTGAIASRLETRSRGTVTGADLTRHMLRSAKTAYDGCGFSRRLVQGDALHLPFPQASFDVLTTSYLLRYVDDPTLALRRLVTHLRPGGRFGMIEFYVPPHPLWRGLWHAHTRILLPVGSALGGPGWWKVGRFLGGSIRRFWDTHDLATLRAMMEQAGLHKIKIETMSLGGGVVAWGEKSPTPDTRP